MKTFSEPLEPGWLHRVLTDAHLKREAYSIIDEMPEKELWEFIAAAKAKDEDK